VVGGGMIEVGDGVEPVVAEGQGGGARLRWAMGSDAPRLWAWRQDESVQRYQPLRPLSVESLRRQLEERSGRRLDNGFDGKATWLIELPLEGRHEPVGWISLEVSSREHGIAAVGYTVAAEHRGRGVATAALRLVCGVAFSERGLDLARLEAVAAVENLASRRVLEKAGFAFEGIARGLLVIGGARVDHARYARLR
jgi:ribosomal-protein-alanine N-acetyltransferase